MWRARFPEAHAHSPLLQAVQWLDYRMQVLSWQTAANAEAPFPEPPVIPGTETAAEPEQKPKKTSAQIRAQLAAPAA